jgi:hypothetical protein
MQLNIPVVALVSSRTSELLATISKLAIVSRTRLRIFILFLFLDDYCSFILSLLFTNKDCIAAVSLAALFLDLFPLLYMKLLEIDVKS